VRALVTGSTGFSGIFLGGALRARGVEVFAVSQRISAPGVTRADLRSEENWSKLFDEAKPDHVFHLSGVAHAQSLAEFAAHNTLAAAALLDAARAKKFAGAILLVGSAAEYGLVPESALPVTESFAASPRTPYGASKYAQTQLALDAVHRGQRVIVARPSNLIGPSMPTRSAFGSFARQLREIELGRREAVLQVGDLSAYRDFIDVRDAVASYLALALDTAFSGLVNVPSGELIGMRSALDALIAAFGMPLSVRLEQDRTQLRSGEISKFSASPALLRSLIGDRTPIDFETSLRDIAAHERAHVH
jgi:GDP-4-dehydro-6-deoxy-D-mannose reductase